MPHDEGLRAIHKDDLKVLLEHAAEQGAINALARLGLDYDTAAKDIAEMRGILGMFRQAKTTAWQTTIRLVTTLLFTALLAGVALKMKVFGGN